MATPAGRGAARRIQVPSDQEEITTEAVLRITYTSNYNSFESQSKKSGRSQQIDTVHPVQSSSYIHWRRSRSNAGLDSYHDKIKPSTENKKIKRTTEQSRPYRSPENYREKLMIQAENKGSQQVTTKKQRKRKKRKAESLRRWRKRKRCRENRQSLIRDNNRASFSPVKFVMAIKTSELNTLTDGSIDE
jgi:hypothetical protein